MKKTKSAKPSKAKAKKVKRPAKRK